MPSDDPYRQFASERRAVLVAPAGCGKTELIARAVGFCSSKQLVLTHTHAGVDEIRARLRKLKIRSSCYQVETIHSFALRYAAAYPKTSSVRSIKPRTHQDYTDIIESAQRVRRSSLIRQILRLSYGGMFVDEYQDCTLDQHDLILGFADVLPCRIVGDPLQGIFDFGDNQIVDWDRDVYPSFTRLPDLADPWRWKHTNPELGKWLTEMARPTLQRKQPLVLLQDSQPCVCMWTQNCASEQVSVLKSALAQGDTTFAICDLAARIETKQGMDRLQAVFHFAFKCLTGILADCRAVLAAVTKGKPLRSPKRVGLCDISQRICSEPSLAPIADMFAFLEREYSPTITRHQLWAEMTMGLTEVLSGSHPSLAEAVWSIRNRASTIGRRIPSRCISRTILLKGLQWEHVIIVDADSLDTRNLYVALTRGSRNLHILSKEKVLWPTDARRSCPKCHSQLTPRMGRNGPFLGCSAFPTCRYNESLSKTSCSA